MQEICVHLIDFAAHEISCIVFGGSFFLLAEGKSSEEIVLHIVKIS